MILQINFLLFTHGIRDHAILGLFISILFLMSFQSCNEKTINNHEKMIQMISETYTVLQDKNNGYSVNSGF